MTLSDTPALYVTAGAGSVAMTNLGDVENLTGVTYNTLEVFATNLATWADWENPWFCNDPSQGYISWVAANPANRRLVISINLIPQEGGSMSDPLTWETNGAAGAFNTHAAALATNLVAAGFGNSIIRLGLECNGNWNIDSIFGTTSPYGGTTEMRNKWAQTFQQEVTAMRAVTGANFLFCWNPNAVVAGMPFDEYYPGDAYVDIIGIDQYDAFANGSQPAPSAATTDSLFAQAYGVNDITAFAKSHGKPLALPEYGIQNTGSGGLGDDPYYIEGIAKWIEQNNFAFHCYFDSGTDGIPQLSTSFPLTLAAYETAFRTPLNSNFDFESGTSPWSANGANAVLSQSASWFVNPSNSAQVSVTASSNFPGMVSEDLNVTGGTVYRFRAMIESPGYSVQAGVHWYDSSRNFISSDYTENTLVAGTPQLWEPNDLTAPSNAAIAVLFIQVDGTVTSGVAFNADKIALRQVANVLAPPVGSRVTWDGSTDKTYSTGVSQAVLYPRNSPGVPWNGLISVTEKGDDNTTSISLDGQLATSENLPGTFAGTLSAYMYPDEFEPCLGNVGGYTSQPRKTFGLCFRDNHQLHIIYNALIKPGSDKYQTLSDNPSALAFSWDFTTLPVDIPWGRPSAHLVIMVDYAQPGALSALEDVLYGDAANAPSLPTPQAIYDLFDPFALLTVTDNGDGTWTASGPDSAITMTDGDHWQITWPSAVMISDTEYRIHSL